MVMVEVDLGLRPPTILPITQVGIKEEVYLGLKRPYALSFLDKNSFYKYFILGRKDFFIISCLFKKECNGHKDGQYRISV